MSRVPFTPNEAIGQAQNNIPDEVIEAFEEMIVKNLNQGSATFLQSEVATLAAAKLGVERSVLFDNNWLDVEPRFRASGWIVDFDNPGYNETYEANFTFRTKRAFEIL